MKIYYDREQMIKDIIPKGTVGCELGVFAGEFSQFLYHVVKPTKLYLIDGWTLCGEKLFTADQDGNGSVVMSSSVLHQLVVNRFKSDPNVHVWLGWTHEKIVDIPDNSLDWIYIDADHSYEGCLRDLELSVSKVKKEGFIMGHDYEINKDKCKNNWNFGVGKAVDTFLERHPEYTMRCKAMDGCVSFCLEATKN